jgi:hypothetical protein
MTSIVYMILDPPFEDKGYAFGIIFTLALHIRELMNANLSSEVSDYEPGIKEQASLRLAGI